MFSDIEQVIKLVLLTLGRLSCFSDGCFSDVCFLDNCFLDGCFLDGCLLTLRQKLVIYFVEFVQIKKNICHYREFICTRSSWQSAGFFYMIICQNLFLPVRIYVHLCFLCVRICMNIKTSKVLIFLFVKNIVRWIIFDWIMNTNIYHHNNITAKLWVLANILAKNF